MFFVGDEDYTEKTREIDGMLGQFAKDRTAIVKLLKNSPEKMVQTLWKVSSPLSKDEDCLFHMGKNLALSIDDLLLKPSSVCDSMMNFYVCPLCKNMKRIIEFSGSKRTNPEEPFLLECGEKAGQSLVYEEKNVNYLYLQLEDLPFSVKRAYTNPFIAELAQCSSATCAIPSKEAGQDHLLRYMETQYLGSDVFTNNLLINYYLNEILLSQKIPNITHVDISFVCNDNGYNVGEWLDIGSIQNFQEYPEFLESNGKPSPTAKADDKLPLNKEVCKSIIMQLFAVLHTLRQYDFSHGNPSTSTLKFKKEICSYIHDGVLISGPITLKMCDFSTSGITIKREEYSDKKEGQNTHKFLRLYSRNVVADEELKKRIYEPVIETLKSEKVTVYKLKNPCKCVKASILFIYMKHLGLPVYTSSFDAYAFMTVLMCERSFYTTILSNPELHKFWRDMFVLQDDFDTINTRVKEIHEKTKHVDLHDILKLLADLQLRCDMIDFGWSLIKNL